MEENFYESNTFKTAQKNWDEKGWLGVTAEDHEGVQSTPDEILVQNPGKTLGELMTNEEILGYIQTTEQNIQSNEGIEKMREHNEDLKNNLRVTRGYLRSIGRLPESI